jgi:hypothetical protein
VRLAFRLIVSGPSVRLAFCQIVSGPLVRLAIRQIVSGPSVRLAFCQIVCGSSVRLAFCQIAQRRVYTPRLQRPVSRQIALAKSCKSTGILAPIDDYSAKSCKNTVIFGDLCKSGLNGSKKLYNRRNFHVLVLLSPKKLHFCSFALLWASIFRMPAATFVRAFRYDGFEVLRGKYGINEIVAN